MSPEDYKKDPNLHVRIIRGQDVYEFHAGQLVSFNFETLNEELQDHVGKATSLDFLLEFVKAEAEKLTHQLQTHKAKLFVRLKQTKELTEKRIEAEVKINPDVIQMEDRLLELESTTRLLQSLVRRMEHRKDLLQTYSSNQRITNI